MFAPALARSRSWSAPPDLWDLPFPGDLLLGDFRPADAGRTLLGDPAPPRLGDPGPARGRCTRPAEAGRAPPATWRRAPPYGDVVTASLEGERPSPLSSAECPARDDEAGRRPREPSPPRAPEIAASTASSNSSESDSCGLRSGSFSDLGRVMRPSLSPIRGALKFLGAEGDRGG